MNAVYRLYENICEFKQRVKWSRSAFMKALKANFPYLRAYKPEKSECLICQSNHEKKKRKVLSPAVLENIQQEEADHFAALRELKNELVSSIREPEVGVEVFAFELQRPLQMPLLPTDESYDLRCLWLSNLCIYDEQRKKVHMYVWDELTANRSPEEVGSCLFKHIVKKIPTTTKKVVLYCDTLDIYQNIQITAMLTRIFNYQKSELQSIEQRFFISGHSSNDCNRCFDTIEKKIKSSHSLFTPDDWIQLLSSAKEAKQNFEVNKMNRNEFLSVEVLMHAICGRIDWSDVKAVTCTRAEPLNIHLRYFNRNTEEVIPLYACQYGNLLTYKYKGEIPISKEKHADLLIKTLQYIPPEKREYYENIHHDDNLKDIDFGLASFES